MCRYSYSLALLAASYVSGVRVIATALALSTTGGSYLFGQVREQERARLAGLSAQFDPVTFRHLANVGVAAGWHCVEVGAGCGKRRGVAGCHGRPCRGGAARHYG